MKRFGPSKFKPSKRLCSSAGMPRADSRDHFYVVKCGDCPQWYEAHDMRPLTAARHACQHAQASPGHEAYVINLHLLKIVHRYRFDALMGPKDPNESPPF